MHHPTPLLTIRLLTPSLLVALLSFSATGCGLLVGNVKPIEEKAENYGVLDLSLESPEWKKLDSTQMTPPESQSELTRPSEISDVAFQSTNTSSIISLNSSCRPSYETTQQSLKDFSKLLFMGITDIQQKTEKDRTLQDLPALETTLRGKLSNEPMMLRAVVVKKRDCVYDLMYISRPDQFPKNETDFERFVASLRLK